MKLAIDIGNTKVKTALFDEDKMVEVFSFSHQNTQEQITWICKEFSIDQVIVSSVASINPKDLTFGNAHIKVVIVDDHTKIPFKNCSDTSTKVGTDRIALVAGAQRLYPQKNILVVDAGTCITYDIITAEGEFLGGAISPGVEMRYKALNQFTAKLPLIEKKKPPEFIGKNTRNCMHVGIYQSVIFEIDGFIDCYHQKFNDLAVILSGGDAIFLSESLKNKIFVKPDLILIGLNHLLEYNLNA